MPPLPPIPDRDLERLRPELRRQAAALYVAANGFARHLFDSPGAGQRALLQTHAGQVFGRQLGRFRAFLVGAAPELAELINQLAAGDDLLAQMDALPDAPPRDVPGQLAMFDAPQPDNGFKWALGREEIGRGARGKR